MRPMNAIEWMDFKKHVKCAYLKCAGGLGLAGHGHCSFSGDWNDYICPKFIAEEEYEEMMLESQEEEK